VCLPFVVNDRNSVDESRRCADSLCADGRVGCPGSGLVLETQPVPLPEELTGGELAPLLEARGEVRLSEPLRVTLDLVYPDERCEFDATVRYVKFQVYAGYQYRGPDSRYWYPGQSNAFPDAVENGLWQLVPEIEFSRTETDPSRGNDAGPTRRGRIEDSEVDVQLRSGGQRCIDAGEQLGLQIRNDLATSVDVSLFQWARSLDTTLECTPCGTLGCELACRFR
jgi:hypothetical protein